MSSDTLAVTYFGASTLLVDDGRTRVMIDGFFTRPSLARTIFGPLRPDPKRIASALDRVKVPALDAVFVAHSHYDHALDAATVGKSKGARLHGSSSTWRIAQAHNVDPARFCALPEGDEQGDRATERDDRLHVIDDFHVTAIPMPHAARNLAPGEIDRRLPRWPWFRSFKSGPCYSFHVRHPSGSLLIQPSADAPDEVLHRYPADVIYLGVARLGVRDASERDRYWQNTVEAVNARVVLPIHWDNFFRDLKRPLRPFPRPIDNFVETMLFLHDRCAAPRRHLHLPAAFECVKPFRWT